jgi:membrane fusion protein (multidrug efflux system)
MRAKTGLTITLFVLILITIVVWIKISQFQTRSQLSAQVPETVFTVTAFQLEEQNWQRSLHAVGTVAPYRGATLKAEAAGRVMDSFIQNGQFVKAGTLLLQIDDRLEQAQLQSAKAQVKLKQLELSRLRALSADGAAATSQVDQAEADYAIANAEVAKIMANITHKKVKAPFDGILGIRQVNLGDYLQIGQTIVELQAQSTVFVNFSLPQKNLHAIKEGLQIQLHSNTDPAATHMGTLTAIAPALKAQTRSVQLQGTFDNSDNKLRVGQYVELNLQLPASDSVYVVPATAIHYASYGNSVYKIHAAPTDGSAPSSHQAKRSFVRIGERRGDFVQILEGVQAGDRVVALGAFKLRTESWIRIDEAAALNASLSPQPDNS